VVFGAGLAVVGYAPALGVAIGAIAVASAGGLLVEVTNTTIFQRAVPDVIRGRALGVLGTLTTVAFAVGSFLLPVASGAVGVGPVLLATGIAVAAAGVVGAFLAAPAARRSTGSTADIRVTRLASLPLFAGVPAAALEAIAVKLVPVAVGAGQVVIRQGDPPDRFYLIEDGQFEVTQVRGAPAGEAPTEAGAVVPEVGDADVAVEPGAVRAEAGAAFSAVPAVPPAHLRTMGPSEVFGEIGLLRSVPRTATVTAATDGRLLALDGSDFLELVNAGPLVRPRLLDLRRGAPGAGY
jgi:CRP-like cAMP-binding protein